MRTRPTYRRLVVTVLNNPAPLAVAISHPILFRVVFVFMKSVRKSANFG